MKKLSIVLIDWGVRTSFHAIDCLSNQTVPRPDYEIIWVEWYSDRPCALQDHYMNGHFDKWIVMEQTGMYFKHRMINEGIAVADGEIVVICDSDALFQPTFVQSILDTFKAHEDEQVFLYLDEVRSSNRSFYSDGASMTWDTVMAAPGIQNYRDGRPLGLLSDHDKIHWANYGSCFCARREDIIAFGGLDEHAAYKCFLCGFYELGWRMQNAGFTELWHPTEWLLHAWHPWVKRGEAMGPNDGLGVNMTALQIPKTGRTAPLKENEKIKVLRGKPIPRVWEGPGADVVTEPAPLQQHTLTFGQTLRSLFRRVRVNRVLLVMEYARGRIAWPVNPAEFAGMVGRVKVFPYATYYHLFGKKAMVMMLINICKRWRPDLIVYAPLSDEQFGVEIEPIIRTPRIRSYYYSSLSVVEPYTGNPGWVSVFANEGFSHDLPVFPLRFPRIFYLLSQFLSWAVKRLPGRIAARVLPDKVKYKITTIAEKLGVTIGG